MKKLLVLFIALCSINSFAIDIKILFVKGTAIIEDIHEVTRPAKAGGLIVEGDRIETQDSSLVVLKIEGHSVHRIEENSTVLIEQLPYKFEDSNDVEQHGSFFLKVGTIFTEVLESSDSDTFEIRTKASVMGVRGTKFMVSQDDDSPHVWLTVDHGEVHIQNDHMGKADLVGAKETMLVEHDRKFTAQKRHAFHKELEWKVDSKIVKKTFKAHRKIARQEHRAKKKNWVRNELRWNKVSENWSGRKEKYQARNVDRKRNTKLKKRLKKMKVKLKKRVEKHRYENLETKKVLLNRPGNTKNPNSFMSRELKRKREMINRDRDSIDKMQRRRRRVIKKKNNQPSPPR